MCRTAGSSVNGRRAHKYGSWRTIRAGRTRLSHGIRMRSSAKASVPGCMTPEMARCGPCSPCSSVASSSSLWR
eukprot:9930385-Prorocentrum_lima.AAC.1